jgi:hypothetical protein
MAKYEDYVKKMQEEAAGTDEIDQAAAQQEERKSSTPDVDWQKRYEDLEVAYSQQGQQMGDYRKLIDEFVSTPAESQPEEVDTSPITPDDIYDNPDEAINRKIDSHPAIIQARKTERELAEQKAQQMRDAFTVKHPDAQTLWSTDEFANWVKDSVTRLELANRAQAFDLTAADALFTLWETEQQSSVQTQAIEAETAVAAVGLESGSADFVEAPERYSRSEMLEQKIAAKQGNLAAERYVKAHGAAYREALAAGNVRD